MQWKSVRENDDVTESRMLRTNIKTIFETVAGTVVVLESQSESINLSINLNLKLQEVPDNEHVSFSCLGINSPICQRSSSCQCLNSEPW